MSWEKVKLGECIDVISGFAFKTKDFCNSGLPIIKIKNVNPPYVSLEDLTYIPVDLANKIPKYELSYDDILIAMTGSHINQWASVVGRVAKVKYKTRSMLNQRVGKIILKENAKANLDYIYYFLTRDEVKIELAAKAGGAANQANISPTDIKNLEIPFPPLKTQNKIADILSAYDDLIENNQKQIKLLEEVAQRLYKQWFIDLRFPGHETTPIVDGLPQGWKRCRIDERFKTVLGGTPSRANPNYWNGNVAWINSGEVNNLRIMKASEYITELALEKSATKMMPVHTTVLAITGATLGQVSYTEIETCANQSVVGIIDETELFSMYLYLFVSTNIKSMIGKATGGAQQHINKDIVNEYKIILPEEHIIKKMNVLTAPLFNKIADCYRQIEKLTESRDRLLPKLMNGELEI